ncbi:hypothetical protein F5Y16DRAFT_392058, partial [Xylariaceae sp. FL0255]
AFKKASLICHLDKRNYYQLSSIPRSRLCEDCAAVLERFSTFLWTFFLESKPFFKLPGSLNYPFAACPICCMGHLAAKHFYDFCRENCQSLLQHLESNHALKPCQECETTDDLVRHINKSELHLWARCPFCGY